MKEKSTAKMIDRWLDQATHDLPVSIKVVVHEEMETHYLDAKGAHLKQGLSSEEAEHLAFSELGNADEVNKELCSTYISRNRLILAMTACLVYPLALIILPQIYSMVGEYYSLIIQDVVSLLVLVYVLFTFVQLFKPNSDYVEKPCLVVIAGIVLNVFDRLFFFVLFDALPLIGMNENVYWNTTSTLAFSLDILFLVSEFITALGVLWLGLRLFHLPDQLFGLQRSTAILLIADTAISLAVISAILLSNMIIASFASMLGYANTTILLALMILIFYRAAFNPLRVPLKFV
jgi:hypothetical protein